MSLSPGPGHRYRPLRKLAAKQPNIECRKTTKIDFRFNFLIPLANTTAGRSCMLGVPLECKSLVYADTHRGGPARSISEAKEEGYKHA